MIAGLTALGAPALNFSVGPATPPAAPAAGIAGMSFEDALGQAVGSAVNTLQTGEAMAIQGVEGAAAPMKVVESVMDAQRSLQSVLAIRDKIVSAWQEVSHMAI
jgi:flagellar hook-basal body complex protein FliE